MVSIGIEYIWGVRENKKMKNIVPVLLMLFLTVPWQEKQVISSGNQINWNKRNLRYSLNDYIIKVVNYLSIYPQVYSQTEHKNYDLTATVIMRNTNRKDTVFIEKGAFFDTDRDC